jgi:MFS family permease
MLGRVRRLIALVSSVIFLDSMLFGALTPLVPGYADQFDLSKLQAGLLIGAYGGGALLGGVPGGVLAGRSGPKRAVVLGLLALTASSVAFALATGPAALGLARFVQGLASTTTWSGALAWITAEAPRASGAARFSGRRSASPCSAPSSAPPSGPSPSTWASAARSRSSAA